MRTWMDVYRQRQRRDRELRFLEQIRLNRAAWSRAPPIEELADPLGKRFLFEGPLEPTQWSAEDLEAL